jgi:hypothetical protein
VLAHAALAALLFCSSDLASHERLNQLQGGWVSLSVTPVPTQMGNIGILNLKKDNRVMILFDTRQSVVGANHDCRVRYRHWDGDGFAIGNEFYGLGDPFFEFLYWQSEVENSVADIRGEQHDAIIKQFPAYRLRGLRPTISSLNKVRAERREQFGVGGRRFANISHVEFDTDRYIAIFESEWPDNLGLYRNPSPISRDQGIFGYCGRALGDRDRFFRIVRLSLRDAFGAQSLLVSGIPKAVGGHSQFVSGLPQTPSKQRDKSGEKRRYQPIVNVKKLSDFNSKELSDLIAGAVLFLGLFGCFAYFIVARDDRKKKNDQSRTNAEPK